MPVVNITVTKEITLQLPSLRSALVFSLTTSIEQTILKAHTAGQQKTSAVILAEGVKSVEAAIAGLHEIASRLETELHQVHPPVERIEAQLLPRPEEEYPVIEQQHYHERPE